MTPPSYLSLVEDKERRAKEAAGTSSGGGGPPSDEVERRFAALEKSYGEITVTLGKLLERAQASDLKLAGIDAKLDAKASAADVAKISGRIDALPSTWQMITLVIGTVGTILGGAFLILKFGLSHSP